MRPRASIVFARLFSGALYFLSATVDSFSQTKSDLEQFRTKAVFQLAIHKSAVLKLGDSKLVTESVFVTRTNKFFGGRINALLIQFFTRPITAEAQADILKNDAKEMTKGDYAALVLFLDQQNHISQINLTYVVPGITVVRTVASTSEDIRKYFSDYHFDHERLRLKSKGSYNEPESQDEEISLSWDVDLDVPVFDVRKK